MDEDPLTKILCSHTEPHRWSEKDWQVLQWYWEHRGRGELPDVPFSVVLGSFVSTGSAERFYHILDEEIASGPGWIRKEGVIHDIKNLQRQVAGERVGYKLEGGPDATALSPKRRSILRTWAEQYQLWAPPPEREDEP